MDEEIIYAKTLPIAIDYQNRKIFIEIELNKKTGKMETIEHKKINQPITLSISGYALHHQGADYKYAGQIHDEIKDPQNVRRYLIPVAKVMELLKIWKDWHLNDLQAGCIHQGQLDINADNWKKLAKKETKKCPVKYEYGSRWLVKELPEEIINKIKSY